MSTLLETKGAKKGSITVAVISAGDPSTGTKKDGSTWRKRVFTVQDESMTTPMTTWDEWVDRFVPGQKYVIKGIYWKEYNGELQLSCGKYTTYEELGAAPGQPTLPTQTAPQPAPTPAAPAVDVPVDKIILAVKRLTAIERIVTESMPKTETIVPAKVGLYTKIIYQELYGK